MDHIRSVQNRLEKRRKGEDAPKRDSIQVVSRSPKKAKKYKETISYTARKRFFQRKQKKWGNEKGLEGRLCSLCRGKTIHLESGTEVSSTRSTKGGGVPDEFHPKATSKITLCEAVKGLPGEKALVSSLGPICSLESRELDCLTEKVKMEDAIKRKCPEITNHFDDYSRAKIHCALPSNPRGNPLTVEK